MITTHNDEPRTSPAPGTLARYITYIEISVNAPRRITILYHELARNPNLDKVQRAFVVETQYAARLTTKVTRVTSARRKYTICRGGPGSLLEGEKACVHACAWQSTSTRADSPSTLLKSNSHMPCSMDHARRMRVFRDGRCVLDKTRRRAPHPSVGIAPPSLVDG